MITTADQLAMPLVGRAVAGPPCAHARDADMLPPIVWRSHPLSRSCARGAIWRSTYRAALSRRVNDEAAGRWRGECAEIAVTARHTDKAKLWYM